MRNEKLVVIPHAGHGNPVESMKEQGGNPRP
jgi:hypothetical protein